MRYLIIIQLAFFLAYGVISGAAFHELYDEKIEALNKSHQQEMQSILMLLPVEILGELRVNNI